MRRNSSRNKKTRADLNFLAIDPKFWYVLDNFMAYILWKFQADSLKIEAWPIQNAVEFLSE
jgi:hypothetical protein